MWSFFEAYDEKSIHIRMNTKHFFGSADKTDRSTDRPTERDKRLIAGTKNGKQNLL